MNDMKSYVMKAVKDEIVKKLLDSQFGRASGARDESQQHQIIRNAQENNMGHLLPDAAHGFMHLHTIEHTHPDEEDPTHVHEVAKGDTEDAEDVTQDFHISKAWIGDTGDTYFESWVSTEDADQQRDIVPPEAFKGAIDDYMRACAPLTSNHDRSGLPVGHLQAIALVRDGSIFASAEHPTDGAAFQHFPATGTGVYARGVINSPSEATAVAKGNLGGMSWYGRIKKSVALPSGGKRYLEIYPLYETTLAAYPINQRARVVKTSTKDAH